MKYIKLFEEFNSIRDKALTDEGSIQTLINKERKIGVISVEKKNLNKYSKLFKEHDLEFFSLNQKNHPHNKLLIIYHPEAKEDASRLEAFAKSRGGYLDDKNEREARMIGRLLSYSESDINKYIQKYK